MTTTFSPAKPHLKSLSLFPSGFGPQTPNRIALQPCRLPPPTRLVACPTHAYNVQVVVAERETEDRLVERFRRTVLRAGVIQEAKRRRFFENTRDKKKRKAREAARRNRTRRYVPKASKQGEKEQPKDYDFQDDNWDITDVEVPYC